MNHQKLSLIFVVLTLCGVVTFMSVVARPLVAMAEPSPTGATIASDYPDYVPGATVTLTGAGWHPGEAVHIFVNDDAGRTWSHESELNPVADDSGSFTYLFRLPTWFVANYTVTATGPISGTATTAFTDLSIGTYDQCANDDGDGYGGDPSSCDWINGNLQSNNSYYAEGDATVQRVWLTDLAPGSNHTITFKYGTTKGGKHAYDFLTTWDWSEDWITLADRCDGIASCGDAAETTLDIPQDPNVPDTFEPGSPGARQFVLRGGTLINATTPTIVSGSYTGDSETVITVKFTVGPNTGPMCSTKQGVTTCDIVLWFGAHVATQANWGLGMGAGEISGSSYHVALDAVDGAAVGQRDNQMQANAVTFIPNGTIVIAKDAMPDGADNFSFNLDNHSTISQSFFLDDDADPGLPNSQTFSVPPGVWYASEFNLTNGWSLTDLVCVDPTGNTTVDLSTATAAINLASEEVVTCTFTDTKALYLTISKDASTSLTRTHTWTIDKQADGEYWKFIGDPATTHTYTVSVDKTTVDSAWAASGNITIVNNTGRDAKITGISDVISPDIAATLTCPVTFPYTLAAGGTLNCTYSASLPNADTRTNTVTVTTDGSNQVLGGTATAEVIFIKPTVTIVGPTSVNVTDETNGETWGPVSDDATFPTYEKEFACPIDPHQYTDGVYDAPEVVNTAIIIETGGFDTATVKLHCYAPVPSKTTDASFTRTYTWDITKDYDGTYSLNAGETVTHDYLVKVTKTTEDSGFVVSGMITVVNPNPKAAMTVALSDSVGGTPATITADTDCDYAAGNLTAPAGSTATCGYSATLGSATNGTNTATVTLNSIDFTATKNYNFVTKVVGYNAINVTDTNGPTWGPLDSTTKLPYTKNFTCPIDPSLYTNGVYTMDQHLNTATITETEDYDTATVDITCHLPALQVTKTAQGEWDRTVTWTLKKSVDPASHIGFAGDEFDSTWTVVADKTDSGPQNYRVTGTIKVTNPAAMAQDFTLSDKLADNTVAEVDCDPLTVGNQAFGTVPAGGYVECTYKALPANDGAKENTVTVSATGNADQSFTATLPWKENLTGYDSGDLTDPHFTYENNISGNTTVTFKETFACSTDPDDYTNGSYTDTFTNWAYLDGNIDLEASAEVGLTCYWPQIELTKTGADLSKRGDKVTYTIKLENLTPTAWGMRDLSCSISDSLIGFSKNVTLASGASDTSTKIFTIPMDAEDPFENTAWVGCRPAEVAAPVVGSRSFRVSQIASWSTNLFQPAIDLIKTGDALSKIGDKVDYTITLYNNSSTDTPDMTCTVTDAVVGLNETFMLGSGLNKVFNIKDFVIPEGASDPFVNTSSVTCGFADFPNVYTDEASWSTNLFQPAIDLIKTGDALSKIGDKVDYTITLYNNSSADTPDMTCTVIDAVVGLNETFMLGSGLNKVFNIKDFVIPEGASDPFVNTSSVTCSPLDSIFSVSDSSIWETELFQPAVEIIKEGPPYAYYGQTIAYTFTLTNQGSADTPDLVFGQDGYVSDDILGDLTAVATAAGCDGLGYAESCTFSVDYTIPDQSYEPGMITNIVSVLVHPAGFSNAITDIADHTLKVVPPSQVTDSSLCIFDRDPDRDGQQFRLLFTQDSQAWPSYKATATNPGQFFYNVFATGTPGETLTFHITLPYPFVTQGANPLHGYAGVSTYTNEDGQTCFMPGEEFFVGSKEVILSNYTNGTYENLPGGETGDGGDSVGNFSFNVTVTVPASGFVYVNLHLDYGLKGTAGYGKYDFGDAVDFKSIYTPPLKYLVPQLADHTFAVSGAQNDASVIENWNGFKKNPGVGGLSRWEGENREPVAGATITLKRDNLVVGTAITDEDGWYQIFYKHTGKPTIYTITLSVEGYTETTMISLKANGFIQIDFIVPEPPPEPE